MKQDEELTQRYILATWVLFGILVMVISAYGLYNYFDSILRSYFFR